MKCLFIIILLLIHTSCTQRDPNPERSDRIFIDLNKELDLVNKNIEAVELELEDRKNSLRAVVPQTGQLKSLEKKVFETENNLDRLRQQKKYFEVKLEARKKDVFARYNESLKRGGREWPDKNELLIYDSTLKMQRKKISYEKSKGMVKDVPRGTEKKTEPAAEANEKASSR